MAKPFLQSSLRGLFISVMGVIFISELLIMSVFFLLGKESSLGDVLIDSFSLIGLVAGPLYLIIFRPFSRQGQETEKLAEMLHAIEQHIPDALVVTNQKGLIERFNPAAERMFGWQKGAVIGRNVSILMPEPHAGRHNEYIQKYLETGKTKIMGRFRELEAKHADGSLIPIEIEASDLHVGARDGFVAVIRDISQRRLAEQEAKQMQQKIDHLQQLESLGVLAGGVSHDFKNILSVIQGNAEIIAMEERLSSATMRHLQGINSGCERAVQLCSQMLTYAGIGSRQMARVKMSDLVDGAIPDIMKMLPKHINLRTDIPSALPEVDVDEVLVAQALKNLVMNAIEATGEKSGHVELAGGSVFLDDAEIANIFPLEELEAGDFIWLQVKDDGEGMSSEVRQHIFEPFFTTKFTGRGLGMSSVLGIMRSHHGAIQVDSSPGKGCSIRLFFSTKDANSSAFQAKS